MAHDLVILDLLYQLEPEIHWIRPVWPSLTVYLNLAPLTTDHLKAAGINWYKGTRQVSRVSEKAIDGKEF